MRRNKNIRVGDKRNTVLEIQIYAMEDVERNNLVCRGDKSWSGDCHLVPRGEWCMLSIIAGGICSCGIPIASSSWKLMSNSSRNFWVNCERSVCPGCIASTCALRLYLHIPGTVLELLGCTHSSQMTGTFVQGVVFDPLSADAYLIPENSGQVEAILNDARLLVSVTAHIPLNVDFPHVPHGRGPIYNPY